MPARPKTLHINGIRWRRVTRAKTKKLTWRCPIFQFVRSRHKYQEVQGPIILTSKGAAQSGPRSTYWKKRCSRRYVLSTLVSEGNSQARWLKLTVRAFTIPTTKRHIVSSRLLLNAKCGDNLSLRVVRALLNIRWTFFSDKNPPVNHNLAPSTTLLSCSMSTA